MHIDPFTRALLKETDKNAIDKYGEDVRFVLIEIRDGRPEVMSKIWPSISRAADGIVEMIANEDNTANIQVSYTNYRPDNAVDIHVKYTDMHQILYYKTIWLIAPIVKNETGWHAASAVH